MTVKELIDALSTFDPEMTVLGEFDSDGDDFMVKVDVVEVYKDNAIDDSNWDADENEMYCIIRVGY